MEKLQVQGLAIPPACKAENARLKRLVAEQALDISLVLGRKSRADQIAAALRVPPTRGERPPP